MEDNIKQYVPVFGAFAAYREFVDEFSGFTEAKRVEDIIDFGGSCVKLGVVGLENAFVVGGLGNLVYNFLL